MIGSTQSHVNDECSRSQPGERFEFFGKNRTRHIHFTGKIGLCKFAIVDMRIDARHSLTHELFVHRSILQFLHLKNRLVAELIDNLSVEQLQVEGLGDIAVRPRIVPFNPAFVGIFGRKQDNRNMTVFEGLLDPSAQFDTVHARAS